MTAALVCVGWALFLAGFVAGATWEHIRKGGSRDLADRLRTVVRLRDPAGRRNA